jgi:ribosomal protein S18 acetylase RimI-like enzyme
MLATSSLHRSDLAPTPSPRPQRGENGGTCCSAAPSCAPGAPCVQRAAATSLPPDDVEDEVEDEDEESEEHAAGDLLALLRAPGVSQISLDDLPGNVWVSAELRALDAQRFAVRRAPPPFMVRRAPSHEQSAFHDQCKHGNLSGMGRQLRAHFTDGQNVAFTVEQGGVFLSGLLVRPAVDAERTAYILLSYTHVQWRQRGLQRLLLSVIEATLGASRLVRQANATADADRVALCGRLGFTATMRLHVPSS